jgi:cytochrome P450
MEAYIKDKLTAKTDANASWKGSNGDILDLALLDPEYGKSASMSELVDQLKTFFFAGHDTTASTISWSYYFLSHHPAEFLRLRKELDEVFGENTTPSQVSKQIIADPKLLGKLEYTHAVIKESLRLEPPAAPAREATPNYHVRTSSGSSIFIPEGAMVYTSAWMLHRNEKVWGDDALEFKPERFMNGKSIPWGYIAFSKRPRDCIGSNLAYLEVIRAIIEVDCRRRLFWRLR